MIRRFIDEKPKDSNGISIYRKLSLYEKTKRWIYRQFKK